MNFIRYNPDTGTILSIGFMDISHIQISIDAGEPILFLDKEINDSDWHVNLATKQIEPK
jgi:hypothetical protein